MSNKLEKSNEVISVKWFAFLLILIAGIYVLKFKDKNQFTEMHRENNKFHYVMKSGIIPGNWFNLCSDDNLCTKDRLSMSKSSLLSCVHTWDYNACPRSVVREPDGSQAQGFGITTRAGMGGVGPRRVFVVDKLTDTYPDRKKASFVGRLRIKNLVILTKHHER